MKHCPACNFTFPHFHQVCDFDGTELVPAPERQALMRVPKNFPRARHSLKSAMLLTSLAVLGLFLGAVAIGYLKSAAPGIPAVTHQEPSQSSSPSSVLATSTSRNPAVSENASNSRPSNRSGRIARSATRVSEPRALATRTRANSPNVNTDKAKERTSSDPKLTAILKTTWKVLKKPFDF